MMRRYGLVLCVCWLVLIAVSATNASGPVASTFGNKQVESIEGTWRYFPDGGVNWCLKPIGIYRIKTRQDGTFTGTYTEMDEHRTLKVSRITFQNGVLRIDRPMNNWYFNGMISRDGMSVHGMMRQQFKFDRHILIRVDPDTFKMRE